MGAAKFQEILVIEILELSQVKSNPTDTLGFRSIGNFRIKKQEKNMKKKLTQWILTNFFKVKLGDSFE
ncbi:hypothetical protein ETSB_0164 [cyanobacterium endosymbiont of Epithemia turgida isolate EtSB Lake Yunoko]|nr:hypothetical protein ETSB_0164 [cyanobacterium endosymbiont of Epithemia turgida isolate EtSB Lake Yunoko]